MNRRLLESYIRESLLLELHKDQEKLDRLRKARGFIWEFITWKKLLWAAIISGALSGPFAAYKVWKIIRKILFGNLNEEDDSDENQNPIAKEADKIKKIWDDVWSAGEGESKQSPESGEPQAVPEFEVNRIIQTEYVSKYDDKPVKERAQGAVKVLNKLMKTPELKR
jgi:hypothetical protein